MTNELYHIGMPRRSGRYPWGSGKRPHQSLEKPKKASDMSDQELTDYIKRKNLERQYDKMSGINRLEKTKNLLNETSNAFNRTSNALRENQNSNQRTWERMNLSNMTDQELRDKINRENLEIQYSKMFNSKSPEVSKGRAYVQKVFDIGGDALAATASTLSILLAIKALKG